MTSQHQLLYCETCSRYPYIGRVSVGKRNRVDFIYQFVKKIFVDDHSHPNIFYIASDIIGTPTKFPNYLMRTYGFDISISPWQNGAFSRLIIPKREVVNNCIDIEFHEAVYPFKISIYEIYAPGSVIKIWAQNSDNQWFPLWMDESPRIVPLTPRLFSPPLRSCNFKTKMLRLEFTENSLIWDYESKLDAVMLAGTSELILPRKFKNSLTNLLSSTYFHHKDVHNLISDCKNAHLDIAYLQEIFPEYCKSDIKKGFHKSNFDYKKVSRDVIPDYVRPIKRRYSHRLLLKNYSNYKDMKLSSDESQELPRCSLAALPDEIILIILRNLELTSLCHVNQVNKRFNNITRCPLLYKRLNIRNVCDKNLTYIHNIFCYFTPRCEYLQQLDLTSSKFSIRYFIKFLNNCGRHLTHLRLDKCQSVGIIIIRQISKICKNLKELSLRYCRRLKDEGLSYLTNLEGLEHLSLCHTKIKSKTLCKILRKNQRMRELNLKSLTIDLDSVAIELRNSCRDLEIINLRFACGLTSQGCDALADCKNLRKINLPLFSSCQRLEEVYLSCISLTDGNLESLTQCKNLKQLYLYKVKFVTPDKYFVIFEQCSKLQEFYFIFCQISDYLINQWKERYPHVFVYRAS